MSKVDDFIEERISTEQRRVARLVLTWLRVNPGILDTIREVYVEGARGNIDAFRAFAGVTWNEMNSAYGDLLKEWGVEPDENWASTLALVIGAWGADEMGQR